MCIIMLCGILQVDYCLLNTWFNVTSFCFLEKCKFQPQKVSIDISGNNETNVSWKTLSEKP